MDGSQNTCRLIAIRQSVTTSIYNEKEDLVYKPYVANI